MNSANDDDGSDPNSRLFDGFSDNYRAAIDDALVVRGLSADFFARAKVGYLMDICRAHFGALSELAVLDVGCGTGSTHAALRKKFKHLAGVDVSARSIGVARRSNPSVEYAFYEGEVLPYPTSSFDLTFAVCVLHHVAENARHQFMREMRRVLRPDGLAVIMEHNPLNPLTRRTVDNCPFDRDAVLLRCEETVRLMMSAGFGSSEHRFILSIPAGTATLRRFDAMFSWLSLGAQYYVIGNPNLSRS